MDIINIPELENIFIHERAMDELNKIKKGWSHSRKFDTWLLERLRQMNDVNFNYSDYRKFFEPIEEFYAITYRHNEKNIRILYSVEDNIKKILLCSFDEKNSSADYARAKQRARQRLKQYNGGKRI